MSTPKAGPLPETSDLIAEVSLRRGERSRNPRKSETRIIRFTVSDGFAVLRQKILRFLSQPPLSTERAQLIDPDVYIKASKNAPQAAYKRLDADAFEARVRERWANITQADVDAFAPGVDDPVEVATRVASEFVFQFFVYISGPVTAAPPGLRRATQPRIADATEAVAAFARAQALGPITRNHLIVSHARQPEGTPVTLPTDNTTRQAQELDEMILNAERSSPTVATDMAHVEVEIGGAWVRLRVRVSSLRLALGLPSHNIFTHGIFHGFTPVAPQPSQPEMEDEDHMMDDDVDC